MYGWYDGVRRCPERARSIASRLASVVLTVVLMCSTTSAAMPGDGETVLHGAGSYASSRYGRIYYEVEGHGPALFLVPGGPGSSHAGFHPWFSRLAKTHTVVYFDNIGRGRSDRLTNRGEYTIARDAEDIEVLRLHLGFARISVLGQSYGGIPALAYAIAHPAHVDHLVLSDTVLNQAGFQLNIDGANAFVRSQYPEVWRQLVDLRARGVKSSDDRYESLFGSTLDTLFWFDVANQTKMFASSDARDKPNADVYTAMMGDDPEVAVGGTMRGYDPSPSMKNFAVPTLIVVGRQDRILPPVVAQALYDAFPPGIARLQVFERSGHRPWVEEPDAYFTTLSAFLDSR